MEGQTGGKGRAIKRTSETVDKRKVQENNPITKIKAKQRCVCAHKIIM